MSFFSPQRGGSFRYARSWNVQRTLSVCGWRWQCSLGVYVVIPNRQGLGTLKRLQNRTFFPSLPLWTLFSVLSLLNFKFRLHWLDYIHTYITFLQATLPASYLPSLSDRTEPVCCSCSTHSHRISKYVFIRFHSPPPSTLPSTLFQRVGRAGFWSTIFCVWINQREIVQRDPHNTLHSVYWVSIV